MNFKEAYQKMLEGKKVKRKGWEGWQYYSLIEDNIFFASKLIVPNITVEDSLADDWEVVEETKSKVKVWKPNKNKKYYHVRAEGDTYKTVNVNLGGDDCIISIGNYFKTEEQAERIVEKVKVIKELQDFALDNNEEEIDWVDNEQDKWELSYKDSNVEPICNNYYRAQAFNIYFASKEIAQEAIKKIGEDRIKKYYFDIED
nr:MAG TPA: Protein of unknown function (DUF2829) [Caudoviricetes sp.]